MAARKNRSNAKPKVEIKREARGKRNPKTGSDRATSVAASRSDGFGLAGANSNAQRVHGFHAIESALDRRSDDVIGIWFDDSRRDQRCERLLTIAKQNQVSVHVATRAEVDELANGVRHQGVVALVKPARPRQQEELFDLLDALEKNNESPLLLILDQVQDPHNLGACLRSADGAGVHAVIVPKDGSAPVTEVVRRVAAGAADRVPLFYVTNLARMMDALKDRGVWMIGTADEADSSIYDSQLTGSMAIVMGAEGKGLRRLTRERCDVLVSIPMAGEVSSLNVSVATGVMLFEAVRQRRQITC